jgi:hypothetical protein
MMLVRLLAGKVRLAVVVAILGSYASVSGCSPEGTNSAPKLKGNKDELQKATQSGGANLAPKAKRRKG